MTPTRTHGRLLVIVATLIVAMLAPVRIGGQFQLALRQASLTGLVLTADPVPKPVRRAIVRVSSVVTATDEEGRYTFPELAPGRYSVTASKGGYVDAVYGTATGLPAVTVTLAEGEKRELKPMKLVRGGVLAGRVLNYKGKPLVNALVAAIPARVVNGVAVRRTGGMVQRQTDGHGEYRLFGLKPGGYVLRVAGQGGGPGTDQPLFQQAGLSAATTFYPGTTELDQIQVLTVRAGEERPNLDFQLVFGPITHVTGTVIGLDGNPVRATVSERTQLFQEASTGSYSQSLARSLDDGTFDVTNGLAPGRHTLAVFPISSWANRPLGAAATFGMVPVVATGNDVTGLTIQLRPAPLVRGQLVFEGATAVPADVAQRWLTLSEVGGSAQISSRVRIAADGTFLFDGVMPGSYTFRFGDEFQPWTSSWFPKSVILGGREVIDLPFDVAADRAPVEITVTMTNQPSEISGRLVDKTGAPAADMVVLVVPDDRRYWLPGSPRIQVLRLTSDGGFKTTGLPAGAYRIVTLSELDPDLRDDPTFLDQVVSTGLRVVLKDGEKWSQTLRVAG